MAVDRNKFNLIFPAFLDETRFSAPLFEMFLEIAEGQLPLDRLGKSADLAVMLYIAHNMQMNVDAEASGGKITGVINSKSVGPVSVGYDTASVLDQNGGTWNLTTYGARLRRLLRASCAGGIYVPPPARRVL